MNKNISETITFLRFPLCVMVVFIHSFGKPSEYDLLYIQSHIFDEYSIFNFVRICFSHVLPKIAVPLFFLFSGYLFFKGLESWDWLIFFRKCRKRITTLFVPYVIWIMIALLPTIARKIIKANGMTPVIDNVLSCRWLAFFWNSHQMSSISYSWIGQPISDTAPHNVPLWFIRDLMVVILFSPIIYFFIKYLRWLSIAVLCLLFISGIWVSVPGFSINAFFFFSLGGVMQLSGYKCIINNNILGGAFLMSVVLLVISIYYDGSRTTIGRYFLPFYIIFGSFTTFHLASLFVSETKCSLNKTLTNCSFFVFAAHQCLVLPYVKRIFYFYDIGENYIILICRYFLIPIISILVLVIIYKYMMKYFPRIFSLVTGNR